MPDTQAALKSLNVDLDALQTHDRLREQRSAERKKSGQILAGTLSSLNGALAELRPELNKTLKSVNEMLADTQPKLSATLTNVQGLTTKLDPLLDNVNKTLGNTDQTLATGQ